MYNTIHLYLSRGDIRRGKRRGLNATAAMLSATYRRSSDTLDLVLGF